ncbi:MAG TPA: cupredoxin domain-containing protein [Candidatus Saccharimonadia bacterium]|nr:cupredoxin domain-containing protein [Candidatus Saccharimonadia bacterium]
MKNKNVIITLVVAIIIVVAVAIYLAMAGGKTTGSPMASASPTPQAVPSSQAVSTIKYNVSGGFSPSSVTIKSGQAITFTNDSADEIQVDSDPHPTHTDNPELNVGTIAAGQSQTIKLTTAGSWGYHNHLNPSDKGRVIVQ